MLKKKIRAEHIIVECGIYNGFGKIASLPPQVDVKFVNEHFNPIEIGELLIDIGGKIAQEKSNITDIVIEFLPKENPIKNGKKLAMIITYETSEEELGI